MRTLLVILSLVFLSSTAYNQSDNPKYDKAAADSLGGDDYGMKMYVLVILKSGSNKITDRVKSDIIFKGHINNIKRLASIGKLTVAGPLEDNDKAYRGIFIFNVKTIEEAKALLATDPAFNAKVLDAELYQWYGSAALPVYLKVHEKIEKKTMF